MLKSQHNTNIVNTLSLQVDKKILMNENKLNDYQY